MARVAIFPGSFDPFTKGHEDIVRRGLQLFDHIVIGIGTNSSKGRYFTVESMVEKIANLFNDTNKVSVKPFAGLTAKFAESENANFLLRGLRNTTDYEYENTLAMANHQLNPKLETVFLITDPALAHISSTVVREIYKYGEDISAFVPYKL